MESTGDIDQEEIDLDIEDISADFDQLTEPTLSVRDVNELISQTVDDAFPEDMWIRGDVQRLRFHSSGHIYFDLVDSDSSSSCSIPVTLLKWNAVRIKENLREILVEDREVRIRARPDFYAPFGRMSLAASGIDAAYTMGQIAIARREIIDKLTKEGILRSNAEREIPEICMTIALVTAVDSAAYHDVIDQLKGSGFGFRITAINALMQGGESVTSVNKALRYADSLGADVVLLCRGGGAKSDLATFDSESVARTIATMSTAVITGLGHQIDVSVSDIVAHSTGKTPTACAQFIIERVGSAVDALTDRGRQIEYLVTDRINKAEMRLANIAQRAGDVTYILDRSDELLRSYEHDVAASSKRAITYAVEKTNSLAALISAHDPMRVLERGYSLTKTRDGKIVRNVHHLNIDDDLVTQFSDGEVTSRITSKEGTKE